MFLLRSLLTKGVENNCVAKPRSSRQREVERLRLENLMAKQDAEQQLRDKKIQLEDEREVVELRMQQQEQEFRL